MGRSVPRVMARASTRYASLRPLPVGPIRKTQWRMASSSDSCTTRSTKSSSGVRPISTAVARMTSSKSMSRLRGGSTPAGWVAVGQVGK